MTTIHGRLLGARSHKPLPKLHVEAWSTDIRRGRRPIGEADSDAEGAFTMEIPAGVAGDVVFHVRRGDQEVFDSTGKVVWNERTNSKTIVLPIPEAAPEPEKAFQATGLVTTEVGVAAAGLKVEVWDHNVDGPRLLAVGQTDPTGRYAIDYDPALLQGKERPDLQIRVLEPEGDGTQLAASKVAYQAAERATTDLTVSGSTLRRTPELARMAQSLQSLLGDRALADVDADGVTYLAERSGWDARAVAMAATATRLSRQTKIPAEHVYALLRAGVPGDLEQLHQLSDEQVARALKTAVAQRLIPDDGRIEQTIEIHREEALRALPGVRAPGAVSTLGDMLALGADDQTRTKVLDIYRNVGDDPTKLWGKLEDAGVPRESVERLRSVAALGRLTLQNAPVVSKLMENGVGTLDDLAAGGFHDARKWEDVIGDRVPEGMTREQYAAGLAAQVNLSAPTLVAADLVRSQAVSLNGSGEEVAAFLTKAHGTHTIGAEPMHGWEGFGDLSDDGKQGALLLERLYQLTPSNQALTTLNGLGIGSALEIAGMPREAFVNKVGDKFETRSQAYAIHQKATEVHTTALNVATMYLAARANPNIYVLTGNTEKQPHDTPDVVISATLEDLFQNMDYCACEECNSVFSPAAYLVDLLEFLDVSDQPHDLDNPLDVLLARRPDLEHLLLSCENTNVALPYVDIVNEVLEFYAVNGNLTTFTGHDTAPDAVSADLLAEPQFVQDAAYALTKDDVYPASLPFDMPLAGMRLLFGLWDTTLADALETFGDPVGARRERLGCNQPEYRILTDTAFHDVAEYFGEAAGTSIDDLNTAVANAKVFCRRTDVEYEDLAAILQTEFVNPAADLEPALEQLRVPLASIQDWRDGTLTDAQLQALLPADLDTTPFGGDPLQWLGDHGDDIMGLITLTDVGDEPVECDFASVELRYALPKPAQNRLDEIAYLRLNRFIRLWRKLGTDIASTDTLITTFLPTPAADLTPANIDAAFATLLDRIGNFQALVAALDISKKKLGDWLALFDTTIDADARRDSLAALLRVGTTDLRHLSEITGIDPLAADMAADEPSLLRFAQTWRAVKASPLKVADLDYLLRSQDATGKLTPTADEQLRDVKALHDALTAVEADIGLAVANPDLGVARAKAALVYDAAVVDHLFAFISHATTYAAPFVSAEETLPAPLAATQAPIDLDPFTRHLTFTGIMSAATQTALDDAADALTLGDVEQITAQGDLDTFIADFKTAVQALRDAGEADLAQFAADYPELAAIVTAADAVSDPAAKAAAVLTAILPELRDALKAQALRTTLQTITKGDEDVVAAVTRDAVLADFLALADPIALDADGTFELLVDPAASGDHIIYVDAPQGTTVTLTLDGTTVIAATAVGASGEVATNVEVALTTGTLHRLDLTLAGLPATKTATLKWRTKAIAKSDIPAARLATLAAVQQAQATLLRLRKAVLLQQGLGLTAGEVTHFDAVDPGTQGFLGALDVDGSIAAGDLHTQWERIERLLWFTQLKADHEPDPDTLVALLAHPDLTTPQGALLLAFVMEWDATSLADVLAHHGLALGDLTDIDNLRTVARTMQLVTDAQQPAADLLDWAVANPDGNLLRAAQDAIRGRMTDAAWREAIQPVNDALRNQRRDALVAHILFHDPPEPQVTTPDRLYEHFLLDCQMDACMQTSRIRLALSTVQQFVNRCLMNLEANVSPGSIRADHWAWMQRYRVWEANRKVFVQPENWLEPELRDGKSPFFRDLESELLKADITDDLAEEAYLNYLKKLDDVAQLEIVAAYLHEQEPGNPDDDVLHVFARTNGTTREYYSRRFEYGYWTPWEKVPLNIEGDLLIPVVWKRQLFLFWVTVLNKPEGGNRTDTPRGIADEGWGSNALTTTELTLSWGEFYNGKWTSPKSTEMHDPLRITGLSEYEPERLVVSVRTEQPDPDISERAIFSVLYLAAPLTSYEVTFTSKHSAPLVQEGLSDDGVEVMAFNYHLLWEGQGNSDLASNSLRLHDRSFEVAVQQPASSTPKDETMLTKTNKLLDGFRVRPLMHPVENQWEAPLFYNDEHGIFVAQGAERVWDESWLEVLYDPGPVVLLDPDDIPPLYEQPEIPDKGDPVIDPWVDVVNPNFTTIIKDNTTFAFDGASFDAKGRIGAELGAGGIGGH